VGEKNGLKQLRTGVRPVFTKPVLILRHRLNHVSSCLEKYKRELSPRRLLETERGTELVEVCRRIDYAADLPGQHVLIVGP
jgi:hypothetical protein